MQVFKTKVFARDARRDGLHDAALCGAIAEMNSGLIHADLGGGLFKQRVAMDGQGKSGSWRTMLGYRADTRAFFLYLFPKSARANVGEEEKRALKKLAKQYLGMGARALATALECGELMKVECNDQQREESHS